MQQTFRLAIEVGVTMNGEEKDINYYLNVPASTEEEAIEKINTYYGLLGEWKIDAIAEHLYDGWYDPENDQHDILEITILDDHNDSGNLMTYDLTI